jgi:peptidoglycan-N-acetylglucosamine deacetylase
MNLALVSRPLVAGLGAAALVLSAGPAQDGRPPRAAKAVPASPAAVPGRGQPIGCLRHGSRLQRHARRGTRTVALTFDDGPWPDTPRFLHLLEREHVRATFFLIGRQVRGHAPELRRMLRDGDAIGNHTYTHPDLLRVRRSVGRELTETSAAIVHAVGYRPCLFRPPYGALNRRVISLAGDLGMTTIVWDVDPRDWSRPGRTAIVRRVLSGARGGSIILMHDGGGDRSQSLSALPRVIAGLRRRGYGFETVAQLLGYRTEKR